MAKPPNLFSLLLSLNLLVLVFAINKRSRLIGIYSICEKNSNQIELHRNAKLYNETMSKTMEKPCKETSKCFRNGWDLVKYTGYDVCEDPERLMAVVLDLIFNNRQKDKPNNTVIKVEEEIVLIVTYISQHLFKLLGSILYLDYYPILPVIILNPDVFVPIALHTKLFIAIESMVKGEFDYIIYLLDILERRKIGILYLSNVNYKDDAVYVQMYREFVSFLFELKRFCFFYDIVELQNATIVKNAIYNLQKERDVSLLLLLGHKEDQKDFVESIGERYGYVQYLIFLHDFSSEDIYSLGSKFTRITLLNARNFRRSSLERRVGNRSEIGYNRHLEQIAQVYCDYIRVRIDRSVRYLTHPRTASNFRRINDNSYNVYKKDVFSIIYRFYTSRRDIVPSTVERLKLGLEPSECHQIMCRPAWQQTWDKLLPRETVWSNEYGWSCRKCKHNLVKSTYGNATCKPCPKYFVPSDNQTICYDPYKRIQFDFSYLIFKVCFIFTATECVINLFIILIFVKNIHTPTAKSSDIPMTLIHLLSSLFLSISLFLTHYGAMTTIKCLFRLGSFSFLYTVNVGVILTKSHTIIKAFGANRRATSKDKVYSRIQQAFTIAMFLLSNVGVLVLSLCYKNLVRVEQRERTTLLIYMYCTGHWHFNVQISLAMIMQCLCFVTAFRGRNLPDVFNEAMSLLYVSLITTVEFGVMFPIQHFQVDPFIRSGVQWILVAVNNLLFLIFCYGRKVHFIIFKSEKNNRNYYQEKTFTEMRIRSETV